MVREGAKRPVAEFASRQMSKPSYLEFYHSLMDSPRIRVTRVPRALHACMVRDHLPSLANRPVLAALTISRRLASLRMTTDQSVMSAPCQRFQRPPSCEESPLLYRACASRQLGLR